MTSCPPHTLIRVREGLRTGEVVGEGRVEEETKDAAAETRRIIVGFRPNPGPTLRCYSTAPPQRKPLSIIIVWGQVLEKLGCPQPYL